jgi:uncharacterized protein
MVNGNIYENTKGLKMKKRLRKKLHKGEFQEFGFDIDIQFQQSFTQEEFNSLLDNFIEMIENQGLMFGGAFGTPAVEGFISAEKGNVTEIHKEGIENWIKLKGDIILSFKIDKKDAWN